MTTKLVTSRGQIQQQKVKSTLNTVVNLFKAGDVPKAISIAVFPPYANIPSTSWSLANRLIMISNDTNDSRGFRQWQKIGRKVKKGAKCFYIISPKMVKKTVDRVNKATGETETIEKKIIVGYVPVPVFAVESTEGEELEYEPLELPELPLFDKAKEWGISVCGVSFMGLYYGSYEQRGNREMIRLATPSEKTWFHELSHAAHSRVVKNLKRGQDPYQEIVAELSAQVLAQLVGTQIESTLGNSYEYIKHYTSKINQTVERGCLSVIADVEKVLNLILS